MQKCDTHLVECLRAEAIYPSANASNFFDGKEPENALDVDSKTTFAGAVREEDGWWCVDFKRRVSVNQYQIKAYSYRAWIYNWKVEISVFGNRWKEVDRKTNTLCDDAPTFTIAVPYPFRYFRIVNNGNAYNTDYPELAFDYVKFIGWYDLTPITLPFTCNYIKTLSITMNEISIIILLS